MRSGTLAFLVGILWLPQYVDLPDAFYVSFLPLLLSLAYFQAASRPAAFAAVGFLWALWHAHLQMLHPLPADYEGETLSITGFVSNLPDVRPRGTRFAFTIATIEPVLPSDSGPMSGHGVAPGGRSSFWSGKVVH